MSARQLMDSLKHVGANFFPVEDSHKFVSTTKKRGSVEQSVYDSMALASCGYGFQWSKWNTEASTGKVIVQAAEGRGGDDDDDDDDADDGEEVGVTGSAGEGVAGSVAEGGEEEEEEEDKSDGSGEVDKVCMYACVEVDQSVYFKQPMLFCHAEMVARNILYLLREKHCDKRGIP